MTLIQDVHQNFSAVLFDMDGTLVDTEPMWLASETELMGRFGYEWTKEDQAHCLGGPLDRVGRYMFSLAGGTQTPEYFTNTLISLTEAHLPALPALNSQCKATHQHTDDMDRS